MKKNMGGIDKIIRIVLAIAVAILIVLGELSGIAAIILGIFAGIFLVTSFMGFCGLYTLFGFSTCPIKDKK